MGMMVVVEEWGVRKNTGMSCRILLCYEINDVNIILGFWRYVRRQKFGL